MDNLDSAYAFEESSKNVKMANLSNLATACAQKIKARKLGTAKNCAMWSMWQHDGAIWAVCLASSIQLELEIPKSPWAA